MPASYDTYLVTLELRVPSNQGWASPDKWAWEELLDCQGDEVTVMRVILHDNPPD